MSKTWQPHQAKKFAREARPNTTYYFVYDVAQNMAPWEDAQLYSEVRFTTRAPFTGNLMTEGGTSAEGLCLRYGPIYDKPPAGMRNVATAGPQVAAPLGTNDYQAPLDEDELRGLEKQARQTSNPRTRRGAGTWRL